MASETAIILPTNCIHHFIIENEETEDLDAKQVGNCQKCGEYKEWPSFNDDIYRPMWRRAAFNSMERKYD